MSQDLEQRLAELDRSTIDVASLWEGVRRDTVRPGWRERLRSLPTALRVLLALAGAFVLAGSSLVATGLRTTFAPDVRLGGVLAVLFVISVASFATSLRGLHRPIRRGRAWTVVALGLLLPAALALLSVSSDPNLQASPLRCFFIGLAVGVAVSLPVALVQRASVPVATRSAAAVTGGGAIAFAWLELHCPARNVGHLLLGHALVGCALVGASLVVARLRRDRYDSLAV